MNKSVPEPEEAPPPKPPVVAIGASAGGLEALKDFLQALPSNCGACFVFIQHLDPAHKSMLPELLRRYTQMEVLQASDRLVPQPNSLVLIPPNATLTYTDRLLRIEKPAPPRQHRTPIDSFFESIAAELGEYGICILLSGTGSDGTHGLGLVKEAGGLTIVQDPKTAKYDSMPRNAMATGLVDYELAPGDIPAVLLDHFNKVKSIHEKGGFNAVRERITSDLTKIFSLLRARTGHDFREYKEATLLRRIHRRMQVLQIESSEQYVNALTNDATEVGKLLREILISVTGFFRDAPAFEALSELVIGPCVASAQSGTPLRIWVPGCASGEEAYTIAMIVHDCADVLDKRVKVQIFATDIDERALEVARRGCYADTIVARVPDRFRARYFRQEGTELRIVSELREMCIFSVHSLIKNPPFSRINLVSCRNLLIYLKPELQERVIPILHYALRPGGALFLGPSENVTKHARLFETVDAKWRIFRRNDTSEVRPGVFPLRSLFGTQETPEQPIPLRFPDPPKPPSTVALVERMVLDRLGPAYAIISPEREVLYTGGGIARYLSVPRGAATHDILAMIKPELRMNVRAVLHQVIANGKEAACNTVIAKEDSKRWRVRVDCAPVGSDPGQHIFVLVFHDCGEFAPGDLTPSENDRNSTVEALERELTATREYLQTMAEELESSNEELKSANEELMSMNEELQSSNEELETSKEELQSVNEELETVNSELAAKVDDLSQTNNDLQNLLQSTQIATLFLDRHLRVRRFTPMAKDLFHLIDGDVGRAITDIVPRIELPVIADVIEDVLTVQHPMQMKVKLKGKNQSFMMRILPYRTANGTVDGIVLTFVDVTDLVHAEAAAERRAAQHDFVAHLGGAILRGERTRGIMEKSAQRIAELLNAQYAKILKRRSATGDFELLSSFGFKEAVGTPVPGGLKSQAGYVLQAGEPVIVEDLREEKRFVSSNLLTDNGVRSGIGTVIPGPDGVWGVLGVHSNSVRSFSAEDIKFIQAVANVLSTGLQREASECALHESGERLSAALRAGNLGVHDFDPQTGHVKWDLTIRELWGVAEDTPINYEAFMAGVHPDDRLMVQKAVDDALDANGSGRYEAVFRVINAKDGNVRWVRADGDVTFEGEVPVRLVGTVTDITEPLRIEQHVQLLMREVNHRAKNMLAVVQSIARQTAKDSKPSEFADQLSHRLQGLAASQDLIIGGDWRWVSMHDLVQSQTSHLGKSITSRLTISGDDIKVTTAAAQGIGLALHELATNAVKYGALSNAEGAVEVSWMREDHDRFIIRWMERDGPPVQPPTRRGFGSTVIERMAANAVAGQVELKFDPDGLSWHLMAPVNEVIYDADTVEEDATKRR